MDKVLLVIGASSDMGIATIKELGADYTYIIAHYRTMNPDLELLCGELGNKMICLQADLALEGDVLKLITEIKSTNRIPTHIIHFPAPQCKNSKFHKIEWNVFQDEINISIRSVILILKTFLPQMAKQKYGRIILMLSFVVEGSAPAYCCNYVVTKYAMLGLVKALATEYASKGITVNGISPAWVQTKYISNQPDLLVQQNAQLSPLGRILEVQDIVPSIRYLFSDDAKCINGQNIAITCGR